MGAECCSSNHNPNSNLPAVIVKKVWCQEHLFPMIGWTFVGRRHPMKTQPVGLKYYHPAWGDEADAARYEAELAFFRADGKCARW